jgi:hypothetical protein
VHDIRGGVGRCEVDLILRSFEEAQLDENTVMSAYLRAYQYRPLRAEPLCELARYCRFRGYWALAYLFAREAAAIPHPGSDERIFVYDNVYWWRARDEWAVAASWTGRWHETKELCERLLAGSTLPASERGRVQRNLEMAHERVGPPSFVAQQATSNSDQINISTAAYR